MGFYFAGSGSSLPSISCALCNFNHWGAALAQNQREAHFCAFHASFLFCTSKEFKRRCFIAQSRASHDVSEED